MSWLSGSSKNPQQIPNESVNQSSQGQPICTILGTNKIHQSVLFLGPFIEHEVKQGGGKGFGGGKNGGDEFEYFADVQCALCSGPVISIGNVWSDQTWFATGAGAESITVSSNYSPQNAAILVMDNGVGLISTYSQTYNDLGQPAETVLNGSDGVPMTQVAYNYGISPAANSAALTTGQYSISFDSIGTFVLSACGAASGGNTAYTGTFTSPTGASGSFIGMTFTVTGFVNPSNNGTFLCTASTTSTLTLANPNGVAETHAGDAEDIGNTYHFSSADYGKNAVVGYQFNNSMIESQSVGLVPNGAVPGFPDHSIVLSVQYSPSAITSVIYYGQDNPKNGQSFKFVNSTPTVAGTCQAIASGSAGTYVVFAAADNDQEVQITWNYTNQSAVGNTAPELINFELFGGTMGQAINTQMEEGGNWQLGGGGSNTSSGTMAGNPGEILPYSGIAHVDYFPMYCGDSGQIQNNVMEVMTPDAYGGGIVDANPILCIWRVLSDTRWGLGNLFPLECIDNGAGGTWGDALGQPGSSSFTQQNAHGTSASGTDWNNLSGFYGTSQSGSAYNGDANDQPHIKVTGFGLSVPTSNTVSGVQISFNSLLELILPFGISASIVNVQLIHSGSPIGSAKTVTIPLGQNSATYTFGSSTDTWGASLTPAILNSSTFGYQVGFNNQTLGTVNAYNANMTVSSSAVATSGTRMTNSTAWTWCVANNLFMSPKLDSQDTAASYISKWAEAFQLSCFNSEGLFKIVPLGAVSTSGNGATWVGPQDIVVALDDSCFLDNGTTDPIKITRKKIDDAYNDVQINYDNRQYQYFSDTVEEKSQAAIVKYGEIVETPQDFNFIHTLPTATAVASLRLKRSCQLWNTYEFNLGAQYSYLEPGDLAEITASSLWFGSLNNINLNLVEQVVRITKVVDKADGTLEITAEDFIPSAHLPTLYNKGLSTETGVNMWENPGATIAIVFEATSALAGYTGNKIKVGATGQTSKWGGCYVNISSDGDSYVYVGQIDQSARIGTLAAPLEAGTGDPDTTSSLVVQLYPSCAPLNAGTSDDADQASTACFVDGEIVSYSSVSATGTDTYTADTYLRRGQFESEQVAHNSGTAFMRLDSSVFEYTYPSQWAGKQIFIKLQSYNRFGKNVTPLSQVTPIAFTLPGLGPGSIDIASGITINQSSYNIGAGPMAGAPTLTR